MWDNFTKKSLKSQKGMRNLFTKLKKKEKMRNFCTNATLKKFDLVSRAVRVKLKILNKFLSSKRNWAEKRKNTISLRKKSDTSKWNWKTSKTLTINSLSQVWTQPIWATTTRSSAKSWKWKELNRMFPQQWETFLMLSTSIAVTSPCWTILTRNTSHRRLIRFFDNDLLYLWQK